MDETPVFLRPNVPNFAPKASQDVTKICLTPNKLWASHIILRATKNIFSEITKTFSSLAVEICQFRRVVMKLSPVSKALWLDEIGIRVSCFSEDQTSIEMRFVLRWRALWESTPEFKSINPPRDSSRKSPFQSRDERSKMKKKKSFKENFVLEI